MCSIDWSLVQTNIVAGAILAALLGGIGWYIAPHFEARSRKIAQERLLEIAKKRTQGVGIRNLGRHPLPKVAMLDWKTEMAKWHQEAIEVVRIFSRAEAERLTTLDLFPPVPVGLAPNVWDEGQLHVLGEMTATLKRMDEILSRNLPLRGD